MHNKARRKELVAEYQQARPEAGVYRIVNRMNNKVLTGSALDLSRIRNKMEFAASTNTTGVLDQRLHKDVRAFGIAAFALEVLEVFDTAPGMTAEEIQRNLATLEELWREKTDPALRY
jgi:hypothetical protein